METGEIRGWLLCQPRPKWLRILAGDGQLHRLDITQGTPWVQIAESIAALKPELIEAMGEGDTLIRAVRPGEVDTKEEPEEESAQAGDPETARFILISRLLADAYRHSTEIAFERLASLFDAVNQRSLTMERTLDAMHKLSLKQLEAQVVASGDAQGSLFEQMLAGFIQGQQQASVQKPNGVIIPPPKEPGQ